MKHDVITRKEAIENGYSVYFTGIPCKYGHVAQRYTRNCDCVVCNKNKCYQNFLRNPEKYRQRVKEYNSKNKEAHRKRSSEYYWDNKEKVAEYYKKWRINNRDVIRLHSAKYRASLLQASVEWADEEAINLIYKTANYLQEKTGIPMDVDHIVPLQGKNVCGLHVENNLRCVPRSLNASKGNRYWPDM